MCPRVVCCDRVCVARSSGRHGSVSSVRRVVGSIKCELVGAWQAELRDVIVPEAGDRDYDNVVGLGDGTGDRRDGLLLEEHQLVLGGRI